MFQPKGDEPPPIPVSFKVGDNVASIELKKFDLVAIEQFLSAAVKDLPAFKGRHIAVALIEIQV